LQCNERKNESFVVISDAWIKVLVASKKLNLKKWGSDNRRKKSVTFQIWKSIYA